MNGSEFGRRNGSYSTIVIGTWQLLSQNVSGNYSTIRLYLYFYYGGGSSVGSSYSTFGMMGTELKSGSYRYYPGYTLLGTVDIIVYHNADGSFPATSVGFWSYSYHFQPNQETWGTIPAGAVASIPRQANITGANNFNSDANPYMTYNNPGNFKMNFRLEFAGATINRNSQYGTSGGYTFQLTETERNLLLSKCPNSNTLTVRYVVATCLNSSSETHWSYVDRTMTVVNSNPIFDYFEFEDVNEKTTTLTGNPATIIKGYSEVYIGIPVANKATAQNYATMSKYRGKIGESTVDILYSDTLKVGGRIQNASSPTIICYAIDSRNNSTSVEKQAENFIAYNPVTKGNISVSRENGVSEVVTLQINGTYHDIDFGVVTNTIKSAKYRYKVTSSSTWSEYQDLEITQGSGNFSYNGLIKGDTEEYGFDIGNSYQFEVVVGDELSSVTFTANLSSGIPNIALAKNGVGIMGKYDESEGGLLQVGGKDILKKDIITAFPTNSTTLNIADIQISLNNSVKIGNKLSISGGRIKIGKGVSLVKVSGNIFVENSVTHSYIWCFINLYRNNTRVNYATSILSAETYYTSLCITNNIFNVQEGDEIALFVNNPAYATAQPSVRGYSSQTWVTVEVIQ